MEHSEYFDLLPIFWLSRLQRCMPASLKAREHRGVGCNVLLPNAVPIDVTNRPLKKKHRETVFANLEHADLLLIEAGSLPYRMPS